MTVSNVSSDRTHPLILFMHIPKTAGTTLGYYIFGRQYGFDQIFSCHPEKWVTGYVPGDFKHLSLEQRAAFQVVRGHYWYGIHQDIPDPFAYVAVLRDPVDRVISHYSYARRRKDHYLHKRIVEENLSLKEYVEKGLSVELDNGQIRMLVGDEGIQAPYGECPAEFVDRAKQHIAEHFAVIGTSERFDETLILLKELFNWSMPFYINMKVSQNRATSSDFPPDVIEAIKKHNGLDLEIYQYADQRLTELIQAHVRFFRLKLMTFRLLNRLYGWLYHVSRNFPKRIRERLDNSLFLSL